jgi:AbrB family looped-hinge helix DNA binding protein
MASERTQIPIDRFGRVVLPKGIRDRLGVSPGTEFEVEEREDAILLKPVFKQPRLIEKEGILVIASTGKSITQAEVNEVREKIWRERAEKMSR